MDDKTTRTSAWLTFSLAFDASARHCQHLRQADRSPEQIGKLIDNYLTGSGLALCEALQGELTADQLKQLLSPSLEQRIEQALAWQDKNDCHHLIGFDHPLYPALLRDTIDAPPLLYAKGDLAALSCPAVAIVGSRKASRTAIDHTHELAAGIASRGVAIVSGLAYGIDSAAHQGALAVAGRTIAVAATEPESVYPRRHAGLARRIVDNGGLILTEYPLGATTLRWYFPRRNRIISGLSLGVLVAEAGLPSGTLTTATHAINQGREVMAVPGSVNNPMARGCHALIKEGAALVESEQDVLDALASPLVRQLEMYGADEQLHRKKGRRTPQVSPEDTVSADAMESRIIRALSATPCTIDDLMTQFEGSTSELSALLGRLEIDGKIVTDAGGRYTRC